jgi:hypothetical protein
MCDYVADAYGTQNFPTNTPNPRATRLQILNELFKLVGVHSVLGQALICGNKG